ncbi:MAG: hypothetical protein ACHQQR_16865, partial [Gemmatimonadales bacterium]
MKTNAIASFHLAGVAGAALVLLATACASAPVAEPDEAPAYGKIEVQHRLIASPKTVAWGYYDAAATPVLRM